MRNATSMMYTVTIRTSINNQIIRYIVINGRYISKFEKKNDMK